MVCCDDSGHKYKMPEKIKGMLTKEMLSDFINEFIDVFKLDRKPTYYDDIVYAEGTTGWQVAFNYMCTKHGLIDVHEYCNNLKWYDYDIFCGELSNLMLDYNLIEEGKID